MDNFNSFKPPVDASNGEPILPTEPENSSATEHDDSPIPEPEEILEQNEFVSEKIGPTSDENGYGTDARGHDINSSDDLGPSYFEQYNEQRTDAAEKEHEKEILKEEKEAFPDWYGEEASSRETANSIPSIEKGLDPKMVEALQNAISQKKESDENFYNALEDIANKLIEASKSNTSVKPEAYLGKDGLIYNNHQDATETPIESESTKVRDETTAAPSASGENVGAKVPEKPATAKTLYTGKDGIAYTNRQDAIDSFKD